MTKNKKIQVPFVCGIKKEILELYDKIPPMGQEKAAVYIGEQIGRPICKTTLQKNWIV